MPAINQNAKLNSDSHLHEIKDLRGMVEKPTAVQAVKRKLAKSRKNYNVTKYASPALTTVVGGAMLSAGFILADLASSGITSSVINALIATGAITTAAGVGGTVLKRVLDKYVTKFRPGKFLQVSNGLQAFLVGLGAVLTGLGFTVAPQVLPFVPIVFGANYVVGQLNESAYFNKKRQYAERISALDSESDDITRRLNSVQKHILKNKRNARGIKSPVKNATGLMESTSLAGSTVLSTSTKFFPEVAMPLSPISSGLGIIGTASGIAHDILMKRGVKTNLSRAQERYLQVNRIANGRKFNILSEIMSGIAGDLSESGFDRKSQNRNVLFYVQKALLGSGLSLRDLSENRDAVRREVVKILRPLMVDGGNFSREALRDLGQSLSLKGDRVSVIEAMPLLERDIIERVGQVINPAFHKKAEVIAASIINGFDIDVDGSENKRLFASGIRNIVFKALSKSGGKVNEDHLKKVISSELPKHLEANFFDDMTIPSKGKLRDKFGVVAPSDATSEALINMTVNVIWDKVKGILPECPKVKTDVKKDGRKNLRRVDENKGVHITGASKLQNAQPSVSI